MTPTPAVPLTRSVRLPGALTVTVTEYGDPATAKGTGVLVLHGGGGPATVAGLAAALSRDAYVVVPTHPGFDGTPRPAGFDEVADLASAHLDLLDSLGLSSVLVFGSSIGGWIAAEMAVRDNHQVIDRVVLANAAGIKLAFCKPEFRPDPAALTEAQRAGAVANQRTLAVYAGEPYMHDPKLRGRLHRVEVPVLVLWGEQDGVIPLAYGRTYASAFPDSRFVPVPGTGHFPFIEDPATVFGALQEFTASPQSVAGSVA
jgi:pimeloyl-ACP methyl ester carboxylesterase